MARVRGSPIIRPVKRRELPTQEIQGRGLDDVRPLRFGLHDLECAPFRRFSQISVFSVKPRFLRASVVMRFADKDSPQSHGEHRVPTESIQIRALPILT